MSTRYLLIILIAFSIYKTQTITGDQSEIKELIINDNNVTSLLFNYGSIGAPNRLGNIADLVWNELGYMFEFGPMIAAKVTEDNQTFEITSDSFIRNFQGDYNPDGTLKWGFLPELGFTNSNSDEIANSKNPDSWPAAWTNWPGEFGEGVLIAENEVFYKINDFTNAEFPYYPFPDDQSKRGLGISVTVRIYQAKYGFDDALIVKYFIKNESPKNLSEVYFGFMGDPHVGGPSDYADDRVGIIKNEDLTNNAFIEAVNTIYNYDADMKGTGGKPAYYMNLAFLETPSDLGLTSMHPAQYTNSLPSVPMNDPLMWEWFTSGINYNAELMNNSGDNVIHFGTGPFTLNSLETKTVSLAIFFSYDLKDVINDALFLKNHYHWMSMESFAGADGGSENYMLDLSSPINSEYNSNINIEWNYQGSDPNAKVMIEYSPDLGQSWKVIHPSVDASGESYLWDITNVNDGLNYLIRLISYGSPKSTNYYYTTSDERFAINKPGENAKPELKILTDFKEKTFTTSPVLIDIIAEDIDNQNISIEIEYYNPLYNAWIQIEEFQSQSGAYRYNWNIENMADGIGYKLKITVSDGYSETELLTDEFSINYYRGLFNSSIVEHTEGNAEAVVNAAIVDPDKITNDTYEISFSVQNENSKKYKVLNLTTGIELILDYPVTNNFSSEAFDGIKLTIQDEKSRIDTPKSGFTRNELNPFVSYLTGNQLPGVVVSCNDDWTLIFNNLDTLSDGSYLYPGDTVQTTQFQDVVVPFKLINNDYLEKADYLISEIDPITRGNGKWDFGEPIILRPQNPGSIDVAYGVQINKPLDQTIGLGDTLQLITFNGITNEDKYLLKPNSNYVLSVEENIPSQFSLSQNYPNPFNPTTIIEYSVPNVESLRATSQMQNVTLKVFDILGREVAELVNEQKSAGRYKVNFNASNLSSGIYLYQLKSGNHVSSMKMLLIK